MATPRPAQYPDWATDGNYPAGVLSFNGTPTKVTPTGGKQAEGYEPREKVPGQFLNWFFNLIGSGWVKYFDGGGGKPPLKQVFSGPALNTTSSTTYAQLFQTTLSESNGGGTATLAIGDIVEVILTCEAWCLSDFHLDVWVQEGGGAEQIITPTDVNAPAYPGAGQYSSGTNRRISISMSFAWTMTSNQSFTVKLKGRTTNGANALTVYTRPHSVRAFRLS